MTFQPQNNNLNYLIDRTFTKVNRLFVLSFARTATGDYRNSFSHYYLPNVSIKDFNVLIDGESFFELPVKNEEEACEEIIDISGNSDYTAGNLLHFTYFTNRLGATMFFIIKKSEETTFEFSQNSAKII